MKIADYGKAITSYIESPTKVEKDKLKLQAGLLEEYLGDDLEYQRAVDDGFQGTKEDYYRYKSTSEEDRTFLAEGTPPPKKPRQLKDLFERINRAVLAVSSNTIAPEFIVPELETLTQEYISDGLISGEDARKFAIERKDYWDKWISENPGGTTPTFDFDNEGKATEVSQEEIIKRVNEADGGIIKGKNLGSREGFAAPALAVPAFNIARTAAMPLIRKGAEIIGGTVLGSRIADTFFPDAEEMEKEKEKIREMTKPVGFPAEPSIEIGTTTGEKPEVKIDTKETFPAEENIKPIAEGFPADTEQLPIIFENRKARLAKKALEELNPDTVTDISEIVKDYRDSKTRKAGIVTTIEGGRQRERFRPASTQPSFTEDDKLQLVNLVIDKFKEKENKLPSATELDSFLFQLSPSASSIAKKNNINLSKRKADFDRNDPAYIATQRENKQLKANENNTITNFADENFFPNTIQLKDGSTVNAEKFFIDNLVKRTELGPSRLGTYDTVLKNKDLAKLFNTNERKIEEVIKNIRNSPDFKAEYPPPRSKNYANEEAAKILKDAREYAKTLPNGELHVQNVLIQERKRIPYLNNLFKDGTLKITDYPRLVEDLNTTMDKKTGIIDKTITKTEKEMTERAMKDKGLFQVFHNVPKSSRQKNIEFLSNRYLSLYKTNTGFVKSAEAYIKNQKDNPDYEERVADFDNYLKERGLRIKIDNKFYGIDFQEMINSDTGEFTGMNRTLEYYGLPKFENGVPLKKVKKAEGGPVYGKYAEQIAKLS